MRRITAAVLVVWVSAAAGMAQQQVSAPADAGSPSAAVATFDNADLAGKLALINDAADSPSPKMGPLYKSAVDYVVSNLTLLRGDANAQEIAAKAARLIGSTGYSPAAESVWQLFQLSDTTNVRLAATDALAVVAKGNEDVINKMNHWLAGQNLLQITGMKVDPEIVDGCVQALAALGDPSSYAVLFSTMEAGYGDPTTNDARNALKLLKGDRGAQLLQVMEENRYRDRPTALRMAMEDKDLSVVRKGKIADAALRGALSAIQSGQESPATMAVFRFDAVGALAQLRWSPAAPLVLENFNLAASEFSQASLSADRLVLSVKALAAMATHEAAVRLSLYLGMINFMTGKGRPFDGSVTLAVIEGLGSIGDDVAYDSLYAVQFLDYPDSVKSAARAAVRNLSVR